MIINAVIYCRVSTKEQTKNLSLPTQRHACRDYCRRHGYGVAREFIEEGESAKTADRTELKALLSYCRENKGRIQAVIVYNLSRFARGRYDHVMMRVYLQKMGVTLRSVTEPIDDSSTGKLMEGVLSAFAQFDNDQKAERTEAGMRTALSAGRWTFKAPLGFLNARSRSGASLLHDPSRAPLLRLACSLVADGRSASDALRQVNAAGLRTPKGRPLSLQTFQALLRNPVIAGRISIPKWGIDRPGDFEPIVTETVSRRIQHRLTRRPERPSTHAKDRDDFPLRRFLRCSACAKPITGSWSRGRSDRYGYYHCPRCVGVRGRREQVEELFLAHLERLKPDPAYVRLFRAIVEDVWRTEQMRTREVEKALAARVASLKDKLQRLEDAFIYDRAIDRATYDRQHDRLEEELALAEVEHQEARLDSVDVDGVLAFAEHLIGNLGRMWIEANLQVRQRIQATIFPEGLPFNGRGFGTAQTCLAFMQLRQSEAVENGMASPTGFEPVF